MKAPFKMTVSQVNDYVSALIDSSEVLSNVCVLGEISNFNNHYKSGHLYFTLKDENSLIKAVMFRSNASRLKFVPKDNMKVLVTGSVRVFQRDGIYQIYAESMIPFGVGDLHMQFEELKRKLFAEGLFEESHKKPLPRFPKRIGIITSPEAAAVADMKNILSRRYPLCEIVIYPSLVQGPYAPKELIGGVEYFDADPECDLIIIGRGGGSFEDLFCFSDEALARAIYSCSTPIISAVGHETDFSISDFVADRRAPTPSAAAEIAVPDIKELSRQIMLLYSSVKHKTEGILNYKSEHLQRICEIPLIKKPALYFDRKDELLGDIEGKINMRAEKIFDKKAVLLSVISAKLSSLNPMAVLARGYAHVSSNDGKTLSQMRDIHNGDVVNIRLSDGSAKAKITETSPFTNQERNN